MAIVYHIYPRLAVTKKWFLLVFDLISGKEQRKHRHGHRIYFTSHDKYT
jgi:hypothetical protein